MTEPGAVTRALLRVVQDGADEHAMAERICRACVEGLDVEGAAISLLTATASRATLWVTDPIAALLEELQFSLNEGACIEAATTGRPVFVPDLRGGAEARRWPVFAAAVIERTRVAALFALPLHWGAVNLGVLDMYRCSPGGLSDLQWRDARSAADTATLLLMGQRTKPAAEPGRGGADWLDHAVGHRAEVHQATGMVLAQLGVSATDALARLRAHAFAEQRPLVDVARDVVDRRLVFTDDMP